MSPLNYVDANNGTFSYKLDVADTLQLILYRFTPILVLLLIVLSYRITSTAIRKRSFC
jgi:hypothetical protein